jgi:hypothetical protein
VTKVETTRMRLFGVVHMLRSFFLRMIEPAWYDHVVNGTVSSLLHITRISCEYALQSAVKSEMNGDICVWFDHRFETDWPMLVKEDDTLYRTFSVQAYVWENTARTALNALSDLSVSEKQQKQQQSTLLPATMAQVIKSYKKSLQLHWYALLSCHKFGISGICTQNVSSVLKASAKVPRWIKSAELDFNVLYFKRYMTSIVAYSLKRLHCEEAGCGVAASQLQSAVQFLWKAVSNLMNGVGATDSHFLFAQDAERIAAKASCSCSECQPSGDENDGGCSTNSTGAELVGPTAASRSDSGAGAGQQQQRCMDELEKWWCAW